MAKEIERKFLVKEGYLPQGEGVSVSQGYLAEDETKTVRVRLMGERGFLTVKGRNKGIVRDEFEYEIPAEDARALLLLCGKRKLQKKRYRENFGGRLWEIDIFDGDNAPLVVAETELNRADETFDSPPWLGEEVSFDRRYFNSYLSEHPYKTW